ncbi:hypothetical protein SNEBB_006585 [Seison nebaliae]|nr:hypothetical protein SNEBB_006585 [Seison nebaliae]
MFSFVIFLIQLPLVTVLLRITQYPDNSLDIYSKSFNCYRYGQHCAPGHVCISEHCNCKNKSNELPNCDEIKYDVFDEYDYKTVKALNVQGDEPKYRFFVEKCTVNTMTVKMSLIATPEVFAQNEVKKNKGHILILNKDNGIHTDCLHITDIAPIRSYKISENLMESEYEFTVTQNDDCLIKNNDIKDIMTFQLPPTLNIGPSNKDYNVPYISVLQILILFNRRTITENDLIINFSCIKRGVNEPYIGIASGFRYFIINHDVK